MKRFPEFGCANCRGHRCATSHQGRCCCDGQGDRNAASVPDAKASCANGAEVPAQVRAV